MKGLSARRRAIRQLLQEAEADGAKAGPILGEEDEEEEEAMDPKPSKKKKRRKRSRSSSSALEGD